MIKKISLKTFLIAITIFCTNYLISQNNLLDEIDYNNENYKIGLSAFKANKVSIPPFIDPNLWAT